MVVGRSAMRNSGQVLGRITLASALLVAGPASVRAAPKGNKESAPVCDATPTLDEARLVTGRDLYARGQERFDAKDYLAAVKAWDQVLLLMPEKEAGLRVSLAYAHGEAYLASGDVQHLHSARRLFQTQLASLEPDSAERADIEAGLADIDAKLEALAQAERQAQEAREEEIRQQEIRRGQEALARSEAQRRDEIRRHEAGVRRIYFSLGGSSLGLGLGSLAAMTATLVGGARLDREGHAVAQSTGVANGEYQDLLARGAAQNQAALATGIVGGVLMAVGGSLLVVAAVRHKQAKRRVAVYPTLGGVQLRF